MVVIGLGGEEDDCGRPETGTTQRPTIDGDEKLHGELGLAKSEPHETREEDGEQEEDMANLMRATGRVATSRWRAIRGAPMAGARKLSGEARKRPYSARFSTGKARGGRGG